MDKKTSLFLERRSIRKYKPEKVKKEEREKHRYRGEKGSKQEKR